MVEERKGIILYPSYLLVFLYFQISVYRSIVKDNPRFLLSLKKESVKKIHKLIYIDGFLC